jgi:hypothetical protein
VAMTLWSSCCQVHSNPRKAKVNKGGALASKVNREAHRTAKAAAYAERAVVEMQRESGSASTGHPPTRELAKKILVDILAGLVFQLPDSRQNSLSTRALCLATWALACFGTAERVGTKLSICFLIYYGRLTLDELTAELRLGTGIPLWRCKTGSMQYRPAR